MGFLMNTMPWHEQGYLDKVQGELKWRIFNETNLERQRCGLGKLARSVDLERFGEYYARDMVNRKYLAHTTPEGEILEERIKKFPFLFDLKNPFSSYGENLAWYKYFFSFQFKKSPENLTKKFMKMLMESSSHRKNILNGYYTAMGIGVAYNKEDTKIIIAQEFGEL